jgi:hypothetical protein
VFGIGQGRISKLQVWRGDRSVMHYDRGWDEKPAGRRDRKVLRKIQNIVAALEFLRTEAVNTGCEEIYTLVNSTFNMCFTLYYLFLRAGHIAANEN